MKLEHFFLDGKVTNVAPNILKAASDNPRTFLRLSDPERFEGLKASIKQGFFAPILVEGSTLEIVGGHQRVDAARELGMKHVPVLFLKDLTPAQKTRIRIADNGAFGAWDFPKLRLQIETLSPTELPMLGLDAATLDVVAPLSSNDDAGGLQPDEKFETVKFKLPKTAAKRINSILEQVCTKQKCRPGTALTYIVELFAQDPENGIDI